MVYIWREWAAKDRAFQHQEMAVFSQLILYKTWQTKVKEQRLKTLVLSFLTYFLDVFFLKFCTTKLIKLNAEDGHNRSVVRIWSTVMSRYLEHGYLKVPYYIVTYSTNPLPIFMTFHYIISDSSNYWYSKENFLGPENAPSSR